MEGHILILAFLGLLIAFLGLCFISGFLHETIRVVLGVIWYLVTFAWWANPLIEKVVK